MKRLLHVRLCDESDVVVARQHIRGLATTAGMSGPRVDDLVLAVSEIARNVLVHAERGELMVDTVDGVRAALIVRVTDDGPGIVDLESAMRDGFSTARGLGLGLPSAQRLVDEFSVDSSAESGTTVVLKMWLS